MERKWDPILKAAKTLMLQKGIAATSMEEIAVEAGTTKRTVYNNFGSKDRLVEAVFNEAASGLREAVPRLSLNAGKDELTAYAEFAVMSLTDDIAVGFQRVMIAEIANFTLIITHMQKSAIEALTAPLEIWLMENHGLKPSQANVRATELIGTLSAEARLDRLTGVRQPYPYADDLNDLPPLDAKDMGAVIRFVEELTT
jgi:AcrR family transcriptional regulator